MGAKTDMILSMLRCCTRSDISCCWKQLPSLDCAVHCDATRLSCSFHREVCAYQLARPHVLLVCMPISIYQAGYLADTERQIICRQEIAQGDWWAVRDLLRQAKDLSAKGADWERKNRLKVYEALCALATRDFATAAQLFLDSIATFTA